MKVWLITGASRGIGLEIAREALRAGDAVVATARNPGNAAAALTGHGHRLLTLPLDVTDQHQAQQAADTAADRFGHIDVLVNNAGRGLFGAVEESTVPEAQDVFATNVFGALGVIRAVLPGMRRRRSGHLLAISSMGGFSAGAGFGVYAASKSALEALHEALHEELRPLGINVTIVEPGVFATDFATAGSSHVAHPIGDYAAHPPAYRGRTRPPGDPADAAAAIRAVADDPQPPLRLPLGHDALARMRAKLAHVAADLDRAAPHGV